MLASVVVAPSPAQAYGSTLDKRWAIVDTDDCTLKGGNLTVSGSASSDYCFLDDSLDDTYFAHDPGGEAVKIEFRLGGAMVAKVEFHPSGEYLWVYDNRDDDDTIYVDVNYDDNGVNKTVGPYRAAELGHVVKDLDIDEGELTWVRVYDNIDKAGQGSTLLLGRFAIS
jgi:hypothetical protein